MVRRSVGLGVPGLDERPRRLDVGMQRPVAEIRIKAHARFVERGRLTLDDGTSVSARAIVIATGSRPRVPKMYETLGDQVLTNETIFELPDLPRSLLLSFR